MKFNSAIFCETILIIMIAHVRNINDIIKDFVALGFIVEIDNYFAQNMTKVKEWRESIEHYNENLVIVSELPPEFNNELKSYIKSKLCCCCKKKTD